MSFKVKFLWPPRGLFPAFTILIFPFEFPFFPPSVFGPEGKCSFRGSCQRPPPDPFFIVPGSSCRFLEACSQVFFFFFSYFFFILSGPVFSSVSFSSSPFSLAFVLVRDFPLPCVDTPVIPPLFNVLVWSPFSSF